MPHAFDTMTLPALALAAALGEIASILARTTDDDYVRRPAGGVSGSVGAHVRHCVDHVRAVLDRSDAGVMTYDRRRRDTLIEHSRAEGMSSLWQVMRDLHTSAAGTPDEPLTLDAQIDRDGGHVRVISSVARELVFVLQHTIHHQASIALILAHRGVPVPPQFGYAPSTLAAAAPRSPAARS